ncbi:MAG: GNAT family N-acetyltransferase [Thermodesulfobacteriota bacterium]
MTSSSPKMSIVSYYPGAIGEIVLAHAGYYHKEWGFDLSFEAQVARELSEFMTAFSPERDGLWIARAESGAFLGSIALDGKPEEGARLRWFIVKPEAQGRGVGRVLAQYVMEFCRKRHRRVFLWTFRGLESARAIYESYGFILAEEHESPQWGGLIPEQKYVWTNKELIEKGHCP